MSVVIIGGLSGSGKSTAVNAYRDMAFFCVDCLPADLLTPFINYVLEQKKAAPHELDQPKYKHFALLVDFNDKRALAPLQKAVQSLKDAGEEVFTIFFEAQDEVILRRFKETRRPHPVHLTKTSAQISLADAIINERELLAPFREFADKIIDTTSFSPHDLRRLLEMYHGHDQNLEITVMSFGFKYGVPQDVDMVIDVRFLPNPHFVPELRNFTGLEKEVSDYVFQSGDANPFLDLQLKTLEFLIPRYQQEGKHYFTIAIGCTGGKHRSVAMTEKLAEKLKTQGVTANITHRDIKKVS